MLNDYIPDVLIGDLFVSVFNRRRDQDERDQLMAALSSPDVVQIMLPTKGSCDTFKAHHTSIDLLGSLSEEAKKFFMFDPRIGCGNGGGSSATSSPVTCDACNVVIRKNSHFIRCADCQSPFIDLCVSCFSNGAEFGSHKRTHRYAVLKNKLGSKKFSKINLHDFFSFLIGVEEKGCLNYSVFNKMVLGGVEDGGSATATRGRASGRGVRSTTPSVDAPVSVPTSTTANAPIMQNNDAEKIYLGLISLLTHCREEFLVDVSGESNSSNGSAVGGGPGNFNVLRDEFEYDYLPEAETVIAAMNPPNMDEPISAEFAAVFEAYNGILDERERRKKVIVSSNLISVREFSNSSTQKKRKTDEKDIFEKTRIFVRPVLAGEGGDGVLKFLENFASFLTTRKRLLDRLKRLLILRKSGIVYEDSTAVQFDIDRKKRGDLCARTGSAGTGGQRIWTCIPSLPSGGETGAGTGGPKMTAIEAFRMLPGSDLVTHPESIQLCLDYFISPQHFHVVELAVKELLRADPKRNDQDMMGIIKEGMIGTTRRFILGAQGLAISGGPGGHLFTFSNIDEIRLRIVQQCRR